MDHLGLHWLIEMYGCSNLGPELNETGLDAMIQAAELAGATVVGHASHCFKPEGFSAVVLVEESHLSIHTWPERKYAAIDLFTCGQSVNLTPALVFLRSFLGATSHEIHEVRRGSGEKAIQCAGNEAKESPSNGRSGMDECTRQPH